MADDFERRLEELEDRIEYLQGRSVDLDEDLEPDVDYDSTGHAEMLEEIENLKQFKEANLEILADLMVKQRELREIQLELDDVVSAYYEHLEEKDLSEELRQEYSNMLDDKIGYLEEMSEELVSEREEMIDDHIALLQDQAVSEKNGVYSRLVGGLTSIGGGLSVAELYFPREGLFDFYTQLPAVAGESPEAATASLALPVLGTYLLARAYDKQTNYTELEREIGKYEAKKDELEDMQP